MVNQDLGVLTNQLDRRKFLQGSGALAAAFALGVPRRASAQTTQPNSLISMDEIMQEMEKGTPYDILRDSGIVLIPYDEKGAWKRRYMEEVFQEGVANKNPVVVMIYNNDPTDEFSKREAIVIKKTWQLVGDRIKVVAVHVPIFDNMMLYREMHTGAGTSKDNTLGIFATYDGKRMQRLPPARGPPTTAIYATYDITEGETPERNDGKIKLLDMSYKGPGSNKDVQSQLINFTHYWIGPNIFLKDNPEQDGNVYRLGNKPISEWKNGSVVQNWKVVGNTNNIK